jgi:hypothetical protein
MRVVGEIIHPDCKITIFLWNNRYLIKFEQGYLEQTYKVDEYDVPDESVLKKIVNETLLPKALNLFQEMEQSLHQALSAL